MADNYLEKKMEEFRSGKKAIRRPSASLEVLLSTLAASDAGGGGGAAGAGAADNGSSNDDGVVDADFTEV